MTVVGADVLLYAVNSSSTRHRTARRWLEGALNGTEPVRFTWAALLAFIRISTRPTAFPRPLTTSEATELVDDWLSAPASRVASPSTNHPALLAKLLAESGTERNLVNDAHLAAVALDLGVPVCTFDRDMARFAGLKVIRPG